MADQLEPGEIALKFGTELLPSSVRNVKTSIISTSGDQGKHLKSAKLRVEFDIDPSDFHSSDTESIPALPAGEPYRVNFDELGFLTSDETVATPPSIVDTRVTPTAFISIDANYKYLHLKIPVLFSKKRDSGD